MEEGIREALRSIHGGEATPVPDWARSVADLAVEAHRIGGRDRLASAVRDGIGQIAERVDKVSIVATGIEWLGGGVAAVERTMTQLVSRAERELILTAYAVTSGSERVWEQIERALETGVRCTLIVDRLTEQRDEVQALLRRLAKGHAAALRTYDFVAADEREGLHAKVLIVDRRVALIGSANLSHRGMVSAHELAVVIEGPTAELMAEQVERLLRSGSVRRFP
jgi:phosphatidylserine/phosphatidylglycerophosphate/cardiolipin synthase-like enzyme